MYRVLLLFYTVYFYLLYLLVKLLTISFSFFKSKKVSNKIIYLELFGPPMAGYTARSRYWSDLLRAKGYESDVYWVITYEQYKQFMSKRHGLLLFQIKTLWKRVRQCWITRDAALIIVRRELLMYNDYGNLFLEKWMRCMHKSLIIDFDDDIAAAKHEGQKRRTLFSRLMLESHTKFTSSLAYYDACIYGTKYLYQQFSPRAISATRHLILPTCVRDYAKPLKQYKGDNVIRIGWVGSSYNLRNIEAVFSQLETLYERTAFEFILICDKVTTIHTTFPLRFIKWSEAAEVENLLQIDIGLMPLFRNDTARGKAAFKLIQYMSLGIVSVASAVTINTDIIEDGANGYLVEDETKWVEVLDMVIRSRSQFAQIGEAAYSRISNTYTFDANEATYLSFIKQQLTGA